MARAMQRALAGFIGTACISFVNYILVFGNDIKEHNEHLKDVLLRLQECNFAQKEIDILSHKVSLKGITPAYDKIQSLSQKKIPSNITELRSFLGLASYY